MRAHAFSGIVAVTLVALTSFARLSADDAVEFNRDVRPILSENCFPCHGPDSAAREADLRLDREAAAKAAVIVPGRPDQSELYRRITTSDESERMPPADSEKSLTADQVATLKQWIEQGADYEAHWSLIPPTKPVVPSASTDRSAAWCRNAIDRFVLARLQAARHEPSPEASKETLIRRVTFDLTGLPPTLEEIDAFVADESPQAYEKVVDRLLASSRYGERMTADWLDVARYSDTYGYQVDRDRFVWPWRDWVIRAFNDNLPYDEFVTRQLAGDLLEGAGREEILATTFNRLHPQKVEGGSVPEEFRVEYVADRTQTFATAFLGLTLECCRCHDHKFDPILQKEYYELSAFFDNIDEAGLYSYFTPAIPTPTLLLPTEDQTAKIAKLQQQVRQAEHKLAAMMTERRTQGNSRPTSLSEVDDVSPDRRATFAAQLPKPLAHLTFEEPPAAPNEQVAGKVGHAVRLTGDDPINLEVGNFTRAQPFTVSLWMQTPDLKERAVVFHRSPAWTDAASRGYELLLLDGRLSWSLIHFWPGNAISIKTLDPIPPGKWQHVAVTYDGASRADGLRIFINGVPAETEVVRDHLTKQITGGGHDHITIGERMRDRGFTDGLVDEFRVDDRQLTDIEIRQLADGTSLTAALETPAGELSQQQQASLLELDTAALDPQIKALREALKSARTELNAAVDEVEEIMVMQEMKRRKPTHVLTRGMYDAPAEEVSPQTPDALPPWPDGAPHNRLGLARWLTDPGHPLTSRVAVNRLWQMCFGRGLVTTPEDFGSQGKPPTHPLLLDWLAVDFVEHDWDVQRMLKQIVTSATYRQSSATTTNDDPTNRLLGRGPSDRLPAEMLRDNALAVSGLLIETLGGPPVKPYEVEQSFKPASRDHGAGLYRRSVYTYWKRTGPAPVMMTLDAAKRDVCQVHRERTASPLQSLVLLNGPQSTEAARVLAERLVQTWEDDQASQLTDLFRLLTSRRPAPAELEVLMTLYDQQRADFRARPQAALEYLSVGDRPRVESLDAAQVAALTSVAATLLNYDECVTKR